MAKIAVQTAATAEGWHFVVEVSEGASSTRHDVRLTEADADRLTEHGRISPTELVRRSFLFLLEREPKESILRRFDLPLIGRYFPEYEAEIRNSLKSR